MKEPHGSPARLLWLPQRFCRRLGAAALHAEQTGLLPLLTGVWSSGKAELLVADLRRKPDQRFPGRRAPSVLSLLFWLAQWVAWIPALGINKLDVDSETFRKAVIVKMTDG